MNKRKSDYPHPLIYLALLLITGYFYWYAYGPTVAWLVVTGEVCWCLFWAIVWEAGRKTQ